MGPLGGRHKKKGLSAFGLVTAGKLLWSELLAVINVNVWFATAHLLWPSRWNRCRASGGETKLRAASLTGVGVHLFLLVKLHDVAHLIKDNLTVTIRIAQEGHSAYNLALVVASGVRVVA